MKFEKQNIFFASDLHIGHAKVIEYDKRPFLGVEEMHTELIRLWNSVVGPDDIVFYLGDFSMGNDETAKWVAHSLLGKIHFIMGNHDKMKDIIKLDRFESIHPYGCEIWVKDDGLDIPQRESKKVKKKDGYQQIILSHYPILSWNRAHHGSYHLHGHCHGSMMVNMPEYYDRNVLDVGMKCIDYTPISYTEVSKIMSKKKGAKSKIDHHA